MADTAGYILGMAGAAIDAALTRAATLEGIDGVIDFSGTTAEQDMLGGSGWYTKPAGVYKVQDGSFTGLLIITAAGAVSGSQGELTVTTTPEFTLLGNCTVYTTDSEGAYKANTATGDAFDPLCLIGGEDHQIITAYSAVQSDYAVRDLDTVINAPEIGDTAGTAFDGARGKALEQANPLRVLYEADGAVWNADTGYWELNGLTDITDEEMLDIYAHGRVTVIKTEVSQMHYSTCRTNLIKGSTPIYAYDLQFVFSGCDRLEVADLRLYKIRNVRQETVDNVKNIDRTFYGCKKLREVLGNLHFNTNSVSVHSQTFFNCQSLETINIYGLNVSLPMQDSPALSVASIQKMIENEAAKAAITVTLHATAYAAAMADSGVQAALEAHPLVTLVDASAAAE